jgi:hypothetical protein
MVVKVIKGSHHNLYEGSHVGFHAIGEHWEDGVSIVVESPKESTTIEVAGHSDTQIFLMNDSGKTIERMSV